MKHAFLIIAHNKFEQLNFLVTLLDHKYNDIYIMIDKKSKIDKQCLDKIKNKKYSKVYFIKPIDIYWADYSQTEAILLMIETAHKNSYDYYHLLSGIDLPIQDINTIHSFFENSDYKLFVDLVSRERYLNEKKNSRMKYKHIKTKYSYRSFNNKFLRTLFKAFRKIEVLVQKILCLDFSKKYGYEGGWGSNWFSAHNDFVEIILEEKVFLKEVFKNKLFSDETFIPLIIEKHNYYSNIYNYNETDKLREQSGNLRFILWKDKEPITFSNSEEHLTFLNKAVELNNLFARKFDIEKYKHTKEFILKINNKDK